jgi:hypothetical protein
VFWITAGWLARDYDFIMQELECATPAGSSPPPHRLAILMSPDGRFLQCRKCDLTIAFPAGVKYDIVADQFEGHHCGSASKS